VDERDRVTEPAESPGLRLGPERRAAGEFAHPAEAGAPVLLAARALGARRAPRARLPWQPVLALHRKVGNAAVARLLAGRRLQRQDDDEAARVAKLKADYHEALADGKWERAALLLNAFNDTDIPKLLPKSEAALGWLRNAAVVAMPGWSGRVTVAIDRALEPARVAKLKADYHQALADGNWTKAAELLNGFNDIDIPKLLPRDIVALGWLRNGALVAMPGWSGRVTAAIDALLRDPWPLMPADERVLHVMNVLVDTYHYPPSGAAGIVGNLWGESGVLPSRVEGSAADTPMRARDASGKTRDFTPDEIMNRNLHATPPVGPALPGVGLAQWTSPARRNGLFAHGADILFDMDAQVAYLVGELTGGFAGVNATVSAPGVTVIGATDAVLDNFERPADPEASRAARRNAATRALGIYQRAHPPPVPVAP
jgi:hypothetical protein